MRSFYAHPLTVMERHTLNQQAKNNSIVIGIGCPNGEWKMGQGTSSLWVWAKPKNKAQFRPEKSFSHNGNKFTLPCARVLLYSTIVTLNGMKKNLNKKIYLC